MAKRNKWKRRPPVEVRRIDGGVDEIVAENIKMLHIERMAGCRWSMILYFEGGATYAFDIYSEGQITDPGDREPENDVRVIPAWVDDAPAGDVGIVR